MRQALVQGLKACNNSALFFHCVCTSAFRAVLLLRHIYYSERLSAIVVLKHLY